MYFCKVYKLKELTECLVSFSRGGLWLPFLIAGDHIHLNNKARISKDTPRNTKTSDLLFPFMQCSLPHTLF